jgi:hypothetical protein
MKTIIENDYNIIDESNIKEKFPEFFCKTVQISDDPEFFCKTVQISDDPEFFEDQHIGNLTGFYYNMDLEPVFQTDFQYEGRYCRGIEL